jgi:hypothetical protein
MWLCLPGGLAASNRLRARLAVPRPDPDRQRHPQRQDEDRHDRGEDERGDQPGDDIDDK